MVLHVQKALKDLNVNLSELTQKIVQFFEAEEFNAITALQTENGYQIVAGDSKCYRMENDVSVTVAGTPDDFTVSLTSSKEEKRTTLPLMLASMFGGGYFLLKNLKSDEAMLKLERDFRQRIDRMIEQTRGASRREKEAGKAAENASQPRG